MKNDAKDAYFYSTVILYLYILCTKNPLFIYYYIHPLIYSKL